MDQAEARRALVVEDHGTTREVLCRLLRVCGYEANAVSTVAEAKLRLTTVDRVFLDLELADGNGVELLRQVRSENLPVRVAVTTGSAEERLLAEVSLLRPDAFFLKPIDFAKIIHWLEQD